MVATFGLWCYIHSLAMNDLIPEEIEITGSEQKTTVREIQNYTGSQYSFVINCTALNAGEDTSELPERWQRAAPYIVGGTATAHRVNRLHRKSDVNERPGQPRPIPLVLTSVSSTTVSMTTRSNYISEYLGTWHLRRWACPGGRCQVPRAVRRDSF